ncbi:2Fe-2S iron-sulfur cluster-binding protein [Sandarakinorhabdus sp. DWP1-3-1]|uniref:2Fe-2S iron-sulfur cluster-binding protein n=1 Tax=Sandarakinorhabdus sp. DWP1-3-1 TaxID=2804627 RepID=UPI003CE8E904
MATITYVEFNGTEHAVQVADGVSLMEGALGNGVPGIDGDCGGNAACATCHIYIDPAWEAKTGEKSDLEIDMLDLADGLQPNSRLACQVKASPDLDGLVVRMPATQH